MYIENTINMVVKHFLFLIYVIHLVNGNFVLPSDVHKCSISDPNFNTCASKLFGKLVNMVAKGIPSLKIKPLDPTYVQHACFQSSPGSPLNLKLELDNITFYGFSQLKVYSTNGTDVKKNVIRMSGVIPNATITANYTMGGNILAVPLSGFGITVINLFNLTLNYESYHSPMPKNGKTYLVVRNITLTSYIEGGTVHYKPSLTNSMIDDSNVRNVLNDNFLIIYEEFKPVINEMILGVISPKAVKFNNECAVEDMFDK